jgi:hypothetical protein
MGNNRYVLGNVLIRLGIVFFFGVISISCSSENSNSDPVNCAPTSLSKNAGDLGKARVFLPDPMSASGNADLLASSSQLNTYAQDVDLSHLSGYGVLQSKYVEVVNGVDCQRGFGAYEPTHQFIYSHQDRRFQEAMTYFFGDAYQANMEQLGYLQSVGPVSLVAHCVPRDNAYFERKTSGTTTTNLVCLGDSKSSPGASYADDAVVLIHELQHASTVDNYSMDHDLNQFVYDEAGALNEAISDFMGLIFSDSLQADNFSLDPRIFSRWALGKFDPDTSHVRGAHRCPVYDPGYPNCDQFPAFGFSNSNPGPAAHVSFVYPDGIGWPYPAYYSGAEAALRVYRNYPYQEEIHDAGVLMEGALWDAYSEIVNNHSKNKTQAKQLMTQLVMESVRHLPAPNLDSNASPVHLIGFASNLIAYAGQIPNFTPADEASLKFALKARGLYDYAALSSATWMAVGTGTNLYISNTPTPGIRVLDKPDVLRQWLRQLDKDPSLVEQTLSTGLNFRLDPGEVAALWFDVQNTADITAGGVLVTATSKDPDIRILDQANIGYLLRSGKNSTQIMYGKINGNLIVQSMNPAGNPAALPIGNSYFKTNPLFDQGPDTAIWVKVRAQAPHGKVVNLEVSALPSNGVAATKMFPVTIN